MTNQINPRPHAEHTRSSANEQARSLAKKHKKITITRLSGSGPGTIQANN
jgi:hypothetical protein